MNAFLAFQMSEENFEEDLYVFLFRILIAWRYLRSKRSEGGVTTMTWISLIGISLSVFALIATLSVRSGFRTELVDTILGANAHVTVTISL